MIDPQIWTPKIYAKAIKTSYTDEAVNLLLLILF